MVTRVGENEWLISWTDPDESAANGHVLSAYHALLGSRHLPVVEVIPPRGRSSSAFPAA